MHPAEHRVLRELAAFSKQLERHWRALGQRLGGEHGELLLAGAAEAEEVRGELEAAAARRGLAAGPAAESAGLLLSARPPAPDIALERNQALRWALHDIEHCSIGLRYAARLAAVRHDDALRALLDGWAERLEHRERLVRDAAIALGDEPDAAIAPADRSSAGRAGTKVAQTVGAVGEWLDGVAARRGGS
jgi:hypothetical protein